MFWEKNNVAQSIWMLPLIPDRPCFRLIDSNAVADAILSAIKTTKLRILMTSTMAPALILMCDVSLIINLTISACYLNELCAILNDAIMLKYLDIERISQSTHRVTNKEIYSTNLKRLIIMDFDDLVMILKRIPNLTSLTIDVFIPIDMTYTYIHIDMIDDCQWEQLITSSFPSLHIFKFRFQCYRNKNYDSLIHKKFKQFQSDFWCKQHHWYTEYSFWNGLSMLYTIPYISNTYELISDTERYCNKLMNNVNTFNNVKELTIKLDVITEAICQYYFLHVTLLGFGDSLISKNSFCFKTNHIESLKTIVNLYNVKHLSFRSNCKLETLSILSEILKQAPQILSIRLNQDILISLFCEDELCNYLHTTIEQFEIADRRFCGDFIR